MRKSKLLGLVAVVVLCLVLPLSAHAAQKLIVNNSTGGTGFVVTDDPRVGIGTANPQSSLHVVDTTTSIARGLMSSQISTDTYAGVLVMRKSRGTEASPVSVNIGDYVAGIQGQGYDGSAYQQSATINYLVDGTVSTGNVPIALIFSTGANNFPSKQERMRITSAGNIGIGTTTPTGLLDINSDGIRIRNSKTPISSGDACNQGDMAWDSSYVYVCVAANTWKRSALSSW